MFTQLIFLTLILFNNCESAKILAIFPTPSISHQVVYRALTQDLISHGHYLTILTPNPVNKNNPNVTEIDLSSTYETFHKLFSYAEFKDVRNDEIGFMRKAIVIFEQMMNEILSLPEVKKLINGKDKFQFDLMIMEHTGYLPLLAFAEIYNCPVIGMTSFEAPSLTYAMFGNEANPVVIPEQNLPYATGEMTFIERWNCLKSLFKSIVGLLLPPWPLQKMNNILRTHFPQITTDVFGLIDRVEIFMVNVHPLMGFIRPLVPNTIQLGFMHIEPAIELPKGDLKKFLDESKNGVIYMSFGSNINSKDLGDAAIEMFVNVFRKLKYDVIWKFEDNSLANKPKNVMIQKWLPQVDLLAHPNVKLFITQGGQQSVEEAIDRCVPMIIIPFLGDQPGIAKKLEQKEIARYIDFDNITESYLSESIEEMTKPLFKKNIENLRDLVYDQPMTSREKAVWWTEYVIRHKGAKHLAYPGRLVPFYQKYCLDFIAIGIILLYFSIKFTKCMCKFLTKSNKSKLE